MFQNYVFYVKIYFINFNEILIRRFLLDFFNLAKGFNYFFNDFIVTVVSANVWNVKSVNRSIDNSLCISFKSIYFLIGFKVFFVSRFLFWLFEEDILISWIEDFYDISLENFITELVFSKAGKIDSRVFYQNSLLSFHENDFNYVTEGTEKIKDLLHCYLSRIETVSIDNLWFFGNFL